MWKYAYQSIRYLPKLVTRKCGIGNCLKGEVNICIHYRGHGDLGSAGKYSRGQCLKLVDFTIIIVFLINV